MGGFNAYEINELNKIKTKKDNSDQRLFNNRISLININYLKRIISYCKEQD